jgi:hypothetical protein
MSSSHQKRSARGSARAARSKRSGLATTENFPKQTRFTVTVVWGGKDLTPRTTVTTDRRKAMRIARSIASNGAPIVLVKKGVSHATMKLVADFSTVGGV